METIKIRPREVRDQLLLAYENRTPVILLGGTGIGKTDMVLDFAEEKGLPVMVKRSAYMDAVDFRLPAVGKGDKDIFVTQHPDWVEEISRKGYVLFADEFAQGRKAVQAAWSEGFLERAFDGVPFHRDTYLVACSNRMGDMAMSEMIPGQILARAAVFELVPHHEDWLVWAKKSNVHPVVVAFITNQPHMLLPTGTPGDKEEAKKSSDEVYRDSVRAQTTAPSPRKWHFVSKAMQAAEKRGMADSVVSQHILGLVGEAAGGHFNMYRKSLVHMVPITKIVADPLNAPIPDNIGVQWAQIIMLAYSVSEKILEPVLKYIERWDPEFRRVFVSTVDTKDRTLLRNAAFVAFTSRTTK